MAAIRIHVCTTHNTARLSNSLEHYVCMSWSWRCPPPLLPSAPPPFTDRYCDSPGGMSFRSMNHTTGFAEVVEPLVRFLLKAL